VFWTSTASELIGAQIKAIKIAEDRLQFKEAMKEIGLRTPNSGVVTLSMKP
jgi:carbamoyl-phosphate synthase large subunit